MKLRILAVIIFACSLCGAQANTASKTLTWTVLPAPVAPLAIVSSSLPDGTVGTVYSASLVCSGGVPPYTWLISSGNLAAGLTLAATTGAITGTPTAQGSYSLTVVCTDNSSGSAAPPPPASTPIVIAAGTPDGVVGTAYSFNFVTGWDGNGVTGGTPPYTVQFVAGSGTLPTGLTLQASGLLAGTPITAGLYNFTIRVIDSLLQTATSDRGINVAP